MKISKILNICAWIIIAFLGSYVILKSCVVFGSDQMDKSMGDVGKKVIGNIGENVIYSSSPLFTYASRMEEPSYTVLKYLKKIFPLQQYASMKTKKDEVEESYNYPSEDIFQLIYNEDFIEQSETSSDIVFNPDEIVWSDTYLEEGQVNSDAVKTALKKNITIVNQLKKEKSFEYLIKNFYIVDGSTRATKEVFEVSKLLNMDMTMEKKSGKPQILILHTHAKSESFADSRPGKEEDTIVGVGTELAKILRDTYGYEVIHDTTSYDLINGRIDRDKAYNESFKGVEKILNENPSIEVVIDLHRDASNPKNRKKLLTNINGKAMAPIMFFHGLSYNSRGPIDYLKNVNQQANLAFSLQLQLKSLEKFPSYTKKIYLKSYRYNMHLKEKYLLIEMGNELNTVEECKNSMEPLAEILDDVLQGKE